MRPRQGDALAAPVLRPLAEQLSATLAVPRGAVVCDLMCDGGVLSACLAPQLGAAGTLVAVDTDAELTRAVATAASRFCSAHAAVTDGTRIPLDDRSCDAVASLLSIVFGDATALLEDARRVLRRGGVAAILVWDGEDPPPHEAALDLALQRAGLTSVFMQRLLQPITVPSDATTARVHDVVRLDTFAHLWAAVLDRPLGDELAAAPAAKATVRAAYEEALARYCAPDGTMRIPVTARLISRRA